MTIEQRNVTIGELCEGYFNDAEEGVVGYDERLDIRPKYQREFVYKDTQRDEVIRTVMKGLPLNVMYWCRTGEDSYEVLDGQQRTISVCEYVDGSFSVDDKYFTTCPPTKSRRFWITSCSSMSVTGRTRKSWTGSASSTSRANSSRIRSCGTPCTQVPGLPMPNVISPKQAVPPGLWLGTI